MDLIKNFGNIMNLAATQKVDFVFIAGDLFEHNYVKKSTVQFLKSTFEKNSQIEVVIVPGNHDPYIKSSYYNIFDFGNNVHILNDTNSEIYFPQKTTKVYGSGFSDFYSSPCDLSKFSKINSDDTNILIAHGTLDLGFGSTSYNDLDIKNIINLNMDYVALGHLHKVIKNVGNNGNIYYSGSPEPMGFDEESEHGVILGEINQGNLKCEFIPTNIRKYHTININISDCFILKEIENKILTQISRIGNEKDFYRIILKGYLQSEEIDMIKLEKLIKERVYFAIVQSEIAQKHNYEELAKDNGILGVFVKKMMNLIDNEANIDERKKHSKAMYLGVEALNNGKIED